MPLMNVFEPLFLLLALTAVVTLITALGFALGGRLARAARIVRRLGIGAVVYFAVVVLVSIFNPPGVYQIGDTRCFDDWCIQVVGAQWREPLVHGLLHLLGHDHGPEMESKEAEWSA